MSDLPIIWEEDFLNIIWVTIEVQKLTDHLN